MARYGGGIDARFLAKETITDQACTDFPGPQLTSIRVNALIPVVKMRRGDRTSGVDSVSATYCTVQWRGVEIGNIVIG
jgi:hypothetical protein